MLTPASGTLADYNSAILNGNSTHVRLVFPVQNVTLTDDDISASGGLRITTVLNPDTDLTIGRAISTELTVSLLNSGTFTGFDWTEEFHVDMGVEQSGVTNWVTVGYFKGKKPERLLRTEVIEFTAYDRMQKFDVLADEFIDSLTFPMTVYNIYSALVTYVGLTVVNGNGINGTGNTSISENPFIHGVTCRQILSWIAEAYCCYIRINADGDVQTRWYRDQTSTYSIDGDDYFDINLDESSSPAIDSVRVSNSQEDTGYIYPVGGNNVIYQIIDNPILWAMPTANRTTVMTNMVNRFSSFGTYVPCSLSAIGNWMVEVGDIIEVGYDNGSTVNMPIFSRTLTWNGGCSDVYECTGKTDRTELTEAQKEQYQTGGQLANKYTIRSGVDITEQGVTISGGKYIKLLSGSEIDIESGTSLIVKSGGNFDVNSGGNVNIKSGGKLNIKSGGGLDVDSGGNVNVKSGANMNIKSGGYLNVASGGNIDIDASGAFSLGATTFDVQSTNFSINSANKRMICGNWKFDNSGVKFTDNDSQYGIVATFGIRGNIYTQSEFVEDVGTCYAAVAAQSSSLVDYYPSLYYTIYTTTVRQATGVKIQRGISFGYNGNYWELGQAPNTPSGIKYGLGNEFYPFECAYFNKLYGSAIKDNLTTTAEGYVLDARQGKTLNDKFSNYVPTANIKNNLTTTDSDYVLDARQGKALNDKIADKMNKASSFSISASSNKTFNIGNSFRGVFFVIGGASNAQDVITVYSTSSGSVAYQKMGSSSNITITTGTGSFKIANAMTSAVYVYVMIFNGSVS